MSQDKQNNNTDEVINGGLGELHPREINLIKKIREEYRYGEITLRTEDGLPKLITETIKRDLV